MYFISVPLWGQAISVTIYLFVLEIYSLSIETETINCLDHEGSPCLSSFSPLMKKNIGFEKLLNTKILTEQID